ncbi:hypothetical protein CMK11_06045, partial [Candidatus Poribacteria bacterium]|nr:hypothetical protein [Candidatus Poribacteria bacterium]
DVAIIRKDQVWSTDITYIPIRDGFMYLVSYLPADMVRHMASAEREVLLGVKTCVDDCVDWAVANIDASVDASEARRKSREDDAREGTKVDIEEADEPDAEPDAAPA